MRTSFARLAAYPAMLIYAVPAHAHVGPHEAIYAWNWDPLILACLALTAVLYAFGLHRSRHGRARTISRWQMAAFWSGWIILTVALVSPVHKIGSALFSVHMGQHTLLMLVASPLMVMGRPLIAFLWALPQRWRERVGRFFNRRQVAVIWRLISAPLAVWVAHAVALWMWHVPQFYSAALENESVHALQHSIFLVTALLFWWTLIHGRYGRMGYGIAVLYVFTTAIHSGALGALLTLADRVWFPIHEGRTAAWHLSALEDQQLAGLLMWIPAGLVFIVIGLALVAAWLGESERRLAFSRTASLQPRRPGA
jgi:cytochrome c oxidase assembly factor CtaG